MLRMTGGIPRPSGAIVRKVDAVTEHRRAKDSTLQTIKDNVSVDEGYMNTLECVMRRLSKEDVKKLPTKHAAHLCGISWGY